MKKTGMMTDSDKLGCVQNSLDKGRKLKELLMNPAQHHLTFQNPTISMETLEELMKRDKQREKDGFTKKIKIGRIPVKDNKVIIVPSVEESKLIHGMPDPKSAKDQETSGKGEGEEGDIIKEVPVENQPGAEGEEGEGGAGEGEGQHGVDTDAYELGKKLTEEFQLPNLKDKGKKVATNKFTYDLTDKYRRTGQMLDKLATLKRIIMTNCLLGNIPDVGAIDPGKLIIAPSDLIFRILSKEREYESQAIVFLARDYSGSMQGKSAETVITQHLMLYSWLMFQYNKLVIPRFILHDTEAKEVPNFEKYYKASTGGGTAISTCFKLINKIISEERLAKDYNIYVFYGTDGDNWNEDNSKLLSELDILIRTANRTGITVARNYWGRNQTKTNLENALENTSIKSNTNLFRMYVLEAENAEDKENISAVKYLISP